MRKLLALAVLLLTLPVLLLAAGTASAEETAVTELHTDCTVYGDGSCQVVLEVQLELTAGTESFSIPVAPDARNITVTGAGCKIVREEKFTRVWLTGLHLGSQRITVSYLVPETVAAGEKGQVFTLRLLYPDWPCSIRNYSVTVRMPKPFDGLPTVLSGYYGDLIDNYMVTRIDQGVIQLDLNEKQALQDHEAMTLSLELPAGYFDLRFLAGKTAATDRLLFFMLLALAVIYWVVFIRNRPVLPKRQAMPPEGGNAGEVPYVLTARKPDLALMVVQWASLGYLTIHRNRKGRIWLTRLIDMGNERKNYEVAVFRSLFARSDRCDVRSNEYIRTRTLAAEKGRNYWKRRVFGSGGNSMLLRVLAVLAGLALCLACFDTSVAPKSWRWFAIIPLTLLGGLACWLLQWVGGSLLRRHVFRTELLAAAAGIFLLIAGRNGRHGFLMFLCVCLQLLVGFALRCGGRRTKTGQTLAAELLGYRRYLLSTSSASYRNNLAADPQYFYRTLPYADALQVGRLFAGSFEDRLEGCDWLDWEGKPVKTAVAFYTRYQRLMAGLRGEREPLLYRPRRRIRR